MSFADAHVADRGSGVFQQNAQLPGIHDGSDQREKQVNELREYSSALHYVDRGSSDSAAEALAQYTNVDSMLTAPPKKVKKAKPPRRSTEESPSICHECKTTDSKLWRRGPNGYLMCNACGLRWRRSNKAKDSTKLRPQKLKCANGRPSHTRSSRIMSLPQSSMSAAQKGGIILPNLVVNSRSPLQASDHSQSEPQVPDSSPDPTKAQKPSGNDGSNPRIDPALISSDPQVILTRGANPAARSGGMTTNDEHQNLTQASIAKLDTDKRGGLHGHAIISTIGQPHQADLMTFENVAASDVEIPEFEFTPVGDLPSTLESTHHSPQISELASNDVFADLSFVKAFVDDGGRRF